MKKIVVGIVTLSVLVVCVNTALANPDAAVGTVGSVQAGPKKGEITYSVVDEDGTVTEVSTKDSAIQSVMNLAKLTGARVYVVFKDSTIKWVLID